MNRRQRHTAIVLIAAGLFLLWGKLFGFANLLALLLVWLGVHFIRTQREKRGYVVLAIGCLLLLGEWLSLVIGLVLLSLGYFYWKSRSFNRDGRLMERQSFLESVKRDREAWILKDTAIWSVIGEIALDLSLSLPEEKETTVFLQGIIGDIDIIVPEDIGVSVEASVLAGQIQMEKEKQAGFLNRLAVRSANFDTSEYKVRFHISYIAGDVNIRVM